MLALYLPVFQPFSVYSDNLQMYSSNYVSVGIVSHLGNITISMQLTYLLNSAILNDCCDVSNFVISADISYYTNSLAILHTFKLKAFSLLCRCTFALPSSSRFLLRQPGWRFFTICIQTFLVVLQWSNCWYIMGFVMIQNWASCVYQNSFGTKLGPTEQSHSKSAAMFEMTSNCQIIVFNCNAAGMYETRITSNVSEETKRRQLKKKKRG